MWLPNRFVQNAEKTLICRYQNYFSQSGKRLDKLDKLNADDMEKMEEIGMNQTDFTVAIYCP